MMRRLYHGVVLATGLMAVASHCAAEAPLNRILIAAVGDSTTAGAPFFFSPIESPPNGKGDPEGQYAYWMMHQRPTWEVQNYGYRGDTTDQIRARLNTVLKAGPRYVIILAGANDILQEIPTKKIANNLLMMYRDAKAHYAIAIAATILPMDAVTPLQAAQIRQVNSWIQKTAEAEHIPFVDLNAVVVDPNNPDRLNGSPDGYHPDVGGYRLMGLAMIPAIDEMERHRPH